MKNFFRRLFNKPSAKRSPRLTDLQQMALKSVQVTEEVEYSCEEVYRLMDQYVEMLKRGEDTTALMPLVERHLKMCGDCREEVEALLRMMDAGGGED
jgi:hypothetical protein